MQQVCSAQTFAFGSYSITASAFTNVTGFSIQTFASGSVQTHQYVLSDFVSSPPLPAGSSISFTYAAAGWLPQSVSTTGTFQNPGGMVQDQATLTLSSDGTYTLQRHRVGPVFVSAPAYIGTLDDTLTIDLASGKGAQSTTGQGNDSQGDNFQQQFTLYSDHELDLTSSPSTSSAFSMHAPPLNAGPVSIGSLLAAPSVRGLSTDGVSRLLLIASVPDPVAPVTFSIPKPVGPVIGTQINLETVVGPSSGLVQGADGSISLTVSPQTSGGTSYAAVVVRAPDTYPDLIPGHANVQVNASQTPLTATSIDVPLYPPPLVLIHGVWSDATAWSEFSSCLESARPIFADVTCPNALPYLGLAQQLVDYKDRNSYQFNDPITLQRVYDSIQQGLRTYSQQGVVATSVDVVAHSMGGLVLRALLAENPSYPSLIHYFITSGTPALGSPLAEKLIAYNGNPRR